MRRASYIAFMRARVSIWTVEHNDLETVVPPDPDFVAQWVRVMAGPQDDRGEESFDVLVCTPGWLAEEVSRNPPVVGRHHLIVDGWDAGRVRQTLTDLFTREEGDDWADLAVRLGRLGRWEFEDYRAQ